MFRFYPNTKIDNDQHRNHPLRVHGLLSDFELKDVWQPKISLASVHSIQLFMDQFAKTNTQLLNQSIAGLLFKIRFFIGRLFKWDEKTLQNQLIPGSIRHRYAQQENLTYADLPHPGSESFIPVYQLENEFLSEIENSTVHGALHLSRIPSGHDTWAIHMTVYVKPKGWLGKFYMALITPFRLWIVYPALMRAVRKNWEAYLRSTSGNKR